MKVTKTLDFKTAEDARLFLDVAKWMRHRKAGVIVVATIKKDQRKRLDGDIMQAFFRNRAFKPLERAGLLLTACLGYAVKPYIAEFYSLGRESAFSGFEKVMRKRGFVIGPRERKKP